MRHDTSSDRLNCQSNDVYQLKQVEGDMQLKLQNQDKGWKKKFNQAAQQHKEELRQVSG
jgi:hypothetical protein